MKYKHRLLPGNSIVHKFHCQVLFHDAIPFGFLDFFTLRRVGNKEKELKEIEKIVEEEEREKEEIKEELVSEPEEEQEKAEPSNQPETIRPGQLKKLNIMIKDKPNFDDWKATHIYKKYGVESTNQLTKNQASELIEKLTAAAKDKPDPSMITTPQINKMMQMITRA